MQTTIIYITGVYDTLDLFTQELKNAFESMGYASFTYDARLEEVSKQALIECIEEGTKKDQRFFCVTFNNLGYNLSLPAGMTGTGMLLKQDIFQSTAGSKRAGSAEEEPNLWETYNIPYINILMDHPFHYEKPLQNAPATSIVLCTTATTSGISADILKISGIRIFCHMPGWNLAAGISRLRSVELMFYMPGHCRSTQLRR